MKEKQTGKAQDSLLGIANPTDKQKSTGEQLLEKWEVEGTPFTVIKQVTEKGTEYWPVMGRYRLTEEPFKTKDEAYTEALSESWFRIMQVIKIMLRDEVHEEIMLQKNAQPIEREINK